MSDPETMACPYCDGMINARALSCRHCGRDLTPVLPLLNRLNDLEARISILESARNGLPLALPAPAVTHEANTAEQASAVSQRSFIALALGFLALLAAHWTIVVWLDLTLAALRLASVAIPFVAGFKYLGARSRLTQFDSVVAVLFAVAAVAAMNSLLGWIDSAPILPEGTAAWRETFFYVLSIGASMFAGMLLRVSLVALAARGLTSLPRLREGVLAVNGKVPMDTLKAIELTILLVSTVVSTIAGLLAGFLGVSR